MRLFSSVLNGLVILSLVACGNDSEPWQTLSDAKPPMQTGLAASLPIDSLIGIQQAQLTANDGAANDVFGFSVALSGDTALVGALIDNIGANGNQGAAYVFTRTGGVWTQQAKLTADDRAAQDYFGYSVALSGDTALVGAYRNNVGTNVDQGAAYVFTRTGGVWTQQQKLTANDGTADDYFGRAVALSGDTALVGAYFGDVGTNVSQGAAYVFTRAGDVWTQRQKLTASDGVAGDSFGYSVALSGDTALMGAYADDVGANAQQGAAYVFIRNGDVWTEQQKLTASDGGVDEYFGGAVALSGNTALVGAFADDVGANANQGSAYVFTRTGNTWTQQQKLTSMDGATNDNFGGAVALSGDMALVGADSVDIGANMNQGSAYVFTRIGGVWTQQQLTAMDGATNDNFGAAVALSADTTLVGAYFHNVGATSSQGSAYVFKIEKDNGAACVNAAECMSGTCVDGVCCNAACGGGVTTDCQACSVVAGAAVDGTCAPVAAGSECRASAGACDVAEFCDGALVDCPADVIAVDGTVCPNGICTKGVCKGSGSGGSGGAAGGGGNGGNGGNGGSGGNGETSSSSSSSSGSPSDPGTEGTCDCKLVGIGAASSNGRPIPAAVGFALLAALISARRLQRRMSTGGLAYRP